LLFCPSLALLLLPIPPLSAAEIHVDDTSGLSAAMDSAGPGDEIILAAGTYTISDPLYPATAGTEEEPIIVRAEEPGAAILETNTAMAFEVRVPHWTFEGLDIQGVCVNHTNCEHAFHIIYQADHTVVRNCVMRDFNAQIKGNGESNGVEMIFPDDVLIEGSELYNESIRATVNPVTPIDVVGGQRWTVRSNFIHDFAKGLSDSVSYAAFYKGNSADGVFERNLVVCEQLHSGGTRVGLSFGGGGSYPDSICEDSDCSTEHSRGIIRNNIVADCSDVGIYLNESSDTGVYNNTLYNTAGLDVRFATSSADIRNNILSETINLRDGGTATISSNLEQVSLGDWFSWFADPYHQDFSLLDGSSIVDTGEPISDVTDDFCGNERDDGSPDLGAVEFDGDLDCDTTSPFQTNSDDPDTGDPSVDTGGPAPGDSGDSEVATGDSDPGDTGGDDPPSDQEENEGCDCSSGSSGMIPALGLTAMLAGLVLWRRLSDAYSSSCSNR